MRSFTGTGSLARLILRRDRFRLAVWVAFLALLPVATANAFFELTPTQAQRQAMAATAAANPAFRAVLGPVFGDSIGALTAWRVGTFGAVLVGLMAILTVARHTRAEEESGRAELLGSTAVGRHALPAAAFAVVAIAGLILGGLIAIGFVALGLPTPGAIAMGGGYTLTAMAFAALTTALAQLFDSASTTRGVATGFLGAVFLLRAIGDSTDLTALSWLTPVGWFTQLRPFAGERWWILGLFMGLTVASLTAALVLASARDHGFGMFPPRPGPETGRPGLRTPRALAIRLQRNAWLGWSIGVSTIAVIYGSVASSIGDLLDDSPQIAAIFERMGGEQGITDAFFAAAVGILSLIAAAYAVRTSLRLQVEEDAKRTDPVLATSTSRQALLTSHMAFSLVGSALMLTVGGAAAGLTYGIIIGHPSGEMTQLAWTTILHIPAVWVVAGLAAALYGWKPQITQLAWAALITFAVFGQLGPILQLPQWILDLSPFTHVPSPGTTNVDIRPPLILLAVTAALVALGYTGFRRRDLS